MLFDPTVVERLHSRIRKTASPRSVSGSLPVLFFGDISKARLATISLNPSRLEYQERNGTLRAGKRRRFETLHSLGATGRASLDFDQCEKAIETMREYFLPGRPVYRTWFSGPMRVAEGLGLAFEEGLATHLDLVQESTDPTWNALEGSYPDVASTLLLEDVPFLEWQLHTFQNVELLLLNGSGIRDRLGSIGKIVELDSSTTGKRKWWTGRLLLSKREVAVAGWDVPLVRAPGLTRDEQRMLGRTLSRRLKCNGIF